MLKEVISIKLSMLDFINLLSLIKIVSINIFSSLMLIDINIQFYNF